MNLPSLYVPGSIAGHLLRYSDLSVWSAAGAGELVNCKAKELTVDSTQPPPRPGVTFSQKASDSNYITCVYLLI